MTAHKAHRGGGDGASPRLGLLRGVWMSLYMRYSERSIRGTRLDSHRCPYKGHNRTNPQTHTEQSNLVLWASTGAETLEWELNGILFTVCLGLALGPYPAVWKRRAYSQHARGAAQGARIKPRLATCKASVQPLPPFPSKLNKNHRIKHGFKLWFWFDSYYHISPDSSCGRGVPLIRS